MGGCVILLQSWALYRMPFIAPRVPRPKTTYPLKDVYYNITMNTGFVSFTF